MKVFTFFLAIAVAAAYPGDLQENGATKTVNLGCTTTITTFMTSCPAGYRPTDSPDMMNCVTDSCAEAKFCCCAAEAPYPLCLVCPTSTAVLTTTAVPCCPA
jgi:hypothetical protein